ncbi:MAG TPA: histidine kinase [Candidatus Dormibacteraeota bacterium]|nr:histidine kinase [Candidatus Dormibacteraeota bacterium]
MSDAARRSTALRLGFALVAVASAGGLVSSLGEPFEAGVAPPPAAIWGAIGAAWLWLLARHSGSLPGLWGVPSALFRWSVAIGAAAVLLAEAWFLRKEIPTLSLARDSVAKALDAALFELGVVALGSLAAFAVARSLIRPVLLGSRPPVGTRDLTLRARFVVAATGAAFATAGVLLSIGLDFSATPDAPLAAFLMTALALIAFAALIGWLVGDDAASAIQVVTQRVRELGSDRTLHVPVVAADEVGDLALATNELEARIRRDEAEAAGRAERERVARELHDSVAKSVSVLSLEVASLAAQADPATRAKLARLEHLARGLAEELRAIVRDTRAAGDREPFEASLRRLAGQHPSAALEFAGDLERVHPLARFETLRILDEALSNAERHADAERVSARLAVVDGTMRLVVEDDGHGIGELRLEELVERGHFGVVGMRERAAILDADLRFEQRKEGGTRVVLDVPLEKESP